MNWEWPASVQFVHVAVRLHKADEVQVYVLILTRWLYRRKKNNKQISRVRLPTYASSKHIGIIEGKSNAYVCLPVKRAVTMCASQFCVLLEELSTLVGREGLSFLEEILERAVLCGCAVSERKVNKISARLNAWRGRPTTILRPSYYLSLKTLGSATILIVDIHEP